jgi:hypothetical protein
MSTARKLFMSETPKRKPGAPTVRTRETAAVICDCVSRGMPFGHACSVAGISFQTFCDWRKDDAGFRQEIEQAVARGVDARLRVIEQASRLGDWRASAWLLEHCQPQHFARNRLEVTGADGAPLAAGVQLYLPQKDGAVIECEPEAPALTEGNGDANGA